MLKRLFDSAFRRARAAEARGELREAAKLYVEASALDEATTVFLRLAERAKTAHERAEAYDELLGWLATDDPRRAEAEARRALARVDEARETGAHNLLGEDRRRLQEAARVLEEQSRFVDAARAYELLGATDELARCLEAGGEIEQLEALLEARHAEESRAQRVRGHVHAYELAMQVGARREAREQLGLAVAADPQDAGLAELERQLVERLPTGARIVLRVGGQRVVCAARASFTLGREGDVVVRGASVSRLHAELARDGPTLVLRDLGSRNGTRAQGVPIAGPFVVRGETLVGLGDDAEVRVTPEDGYVQLRVEKGLDRGTVALVGLGAMRVPGLAARVSAGADAVVLEGLTGARVVLGGQACVAPVELLHGDVLEVDGVRVEVER